VLARPICPRSRYWDHYLSGGSFRVSPNHCRLYASQQQQFTSDRYRGKYQRCVTGLQSQLGTLNSQCYILPRLPYDSSNCFCDRNQPRPTALSRPLPRQSFAPAVRLVRSLSTPWRRLHDSLGNNGVRHSFAGGRFLHNESHRQHPRSRSLPPIATGVFSYQFSVPLKLLGCPQVCRTYFTSRKAVSTPQSRNAI